MSNAINYFIHDYDLPNFYGVLENTCIIIIKKNLSNQRFCLSSKQKKNYFTILSLEKITLRGEKEETFTLRMKYLPTVVHHPTNNGRYFMVGIAFLK